MSEPAPSAKEEVPSDFAQQAAQPTPGLIRELVGFLRQSGKWWLVPILLGLLGIGILVVLAETAVAPFIYTLF